MEPDMALLMNIYDLLSARISMIIYFASLETMHIH